MKVIAKSGQRLDRDSRSESILCPRLLCLFPLVHRPVILSFRFCPAFHGGVVALHHTVRAVLDIDAQMHGVCSYGGEDPARSAREQVDSSSSCF